MNITAFFLVSTLTVLASCTGQNISQEINNSLGYPLSTLAKADTVKALGNNIMTIYQDKRNNYWFGSWEDGLYKYDGKTILHFTTKSGLPHNRVEDIQEDKWGDLYFNTSGGVCKFDGQNLSRLYPQESDAWNLHPDDLWFKSLQLGERVYRYDGSVLYSLQLPECALGKAWVAKHPSHLSPYAVYTIYKDSKGNVWFGTALLGAFRYNGQSFDWISEEDVTELHNGPANGVRSIIEDKDGYFWFNSAYRYDVYGKSNLQKPAFYRREKSIGNLDGKPDSDFWEYLSIAKDNNHALWIATYTNGVWQYDGEKTTYYPVRNINPFQPTQADGRDIHLFYVYKDNKGDLWLGTHENGAYQFNGKTFERFKP